MFDALQGAWWCQRQLTADDGHAFFGNGDA
jgi:hypothetical protein